VRGGEIVGGQPRHRAPVVFGEGPEKASGDGYSVVGVRAEYRFSERASVFASIDNLFDEEYATFGLFGQADEVLGSEFDEPYFVGPGAPRAAWVGFRIEL